MLQQLELHEFMELAKTAKRVAVYREIPADRLTPIGIVENLAEEMADGAVLESGLRHQDAGRFSFIMYDSLAQLSVKDNIVSQRIGSKTTIRPCRPCRRYGNF